MAIFNVRLDEKMQVDLAAAARAKRVNKSEIVREALSDYFREDKPLCAGAYDMDDDWSEFGSAVLESQRKIMSKAIARLSEDEWTDAVEPVYAALREKVVQKSRAYESNPSIFPDSFAEEEGPFRPAVVAAIGFAADDVHEIRVSLEQLFFEYAWLAGDKAFAEIPAIWEAAKVRVDGGEPAPTREQAMQARNTKAL